MTTSQQVRQAFARALDLAPDREAAIRATAQALAVPVDAVRGVVGV